MIHVKANDPGSLNDRINFQRHKLIILKVTKQEHQYGQHEKKNGGQYLYQAHPFNEDRFEFFRCYTEVNC